jgi:uncharacterized membrane protein
VQSEAPVGGRDRGGIAVAAVFSLVLFAITAMRHRNGWTGGLDLGIFDQGVWLLSEGLAPEVTVNGRNLFADHLSPVLLLFVPLYVLVATPLWLLAGQAAAIGAGVVPVRRLARRRSVDVTAVTASYVLSAALLSAVFFDFHPSTLAVAPLAWLVASIGEDRRRPVVVATVLVLLCRSDLGLVVAALAIPARPRHRVPLVSIGVAGVVLGAVVPAALGGEGTFEIHYGHIADSPGGVLRRPWELVSAFSVDDLATVLFWALGGVLVLLAPRWALATVVAGLPVLLSRWPGTEDPWFHYGAPLVPLVLAGSVEGLRHSHHWARPATLVAGVVLATVLASPISPEAPEPYSFSSVWSENFDGGLADAVEVVPEGAPVSATNYYLPRLTHRRLVYGFPIPFVTGELGVLYGAANPEVASRIDVVLGRPRDREDMERLGFEIEDRGPVLIGRR